MKLTISRLATAPLSKLQIINNNDKTTQLNHNDFLIEKLSSNNEQNTLM